jgi:hypothetical protein
LGRRGFRSRKEVGGEGVGVLMCVCSLVIFAVWLWTFLAIGDTKNEFYGRQFHSFRAIFHV